MDIVAVRIVGSNGSQDTINGDNVRGSATMGSRRGVECRTEHARSLHYAHCGPDCNWSTHVQAQELSHRQGGTRRWRVLSEKQQISLRMDIFSHWYCKRDAIPSFFVPFYVAKSPIFDVVHPSHVVTIPLHCLFGGLVAIWNTILHVVLFIYMY